MAERVATWSLALIARIVLPLLCASVLVRALPYRTTVDGIPFRVQVTIFSRKGFSADTTLGNWEFPHVSPLPVGAHVSPDNVDLLRLTREASPDTASFVATLRDHFTDRVPWMVLWLVGETVIGVAVGILLTAALGLAARYLRGKERRTGEWRRIGVQLGAGLGVLVVLAAYGIVTFNSSWAKQSRLTGTLAAFQLFPDQLEKYYSQQSKAYDALGAVIGIQAALQQQIDRAETPPTAFNIMYISDVHLAAVYPLVRQYADNFGVKLIVNTGDESEFGSAVEMTPSYLAAIKAITSTIPMIWLAGNHDSPTVESIMRGIPGVTVLGDKTRNADGSISVTASETTAYGLTIAGLPDPRVYGAAGVYGSDDTSLVDKLEQATVDEVTKTIAKERTFDIFATHEPVAAAQLTKNLPGRIRQTNSGHTHAQNSISDVQKGSNIDLVEGSTGAGGLDNLNRTTTRPPIEFSIESVTANCLFTRVLRFQLNNAATPTGPDAATFGDDVSVSTLYLTPQKLPSDRVCGTRLGVASPLPLG